MMKCFLVSFLSILASVSSSNFDCELCSDQEYNSCPYVEPSSTCQVVSEPNCGCCYMCAKKVGEACGTAVGQCEENLECLPPPETALFRNDDDSTLNKICYRKSGRKRATINLLRAVAKGAVKVKSLVSRNYRNMQPILPGGSPSEIPTTVYSGITKGCLRHEEEVYEKDSFERHEWIPACTLNGDYQPLQCELTFGFTRGRCWCVNRKGVKKSGFVSYENVAECHNPRF